MPRALHLAHTLIRSRTNGIVESHVQIDTHLSKVPSCTVATLVAAAQPQMVYHALLQVAIWITKSRASAPGDEWNVALAWYFPLISHTLTPLTPLTSGSTSAMLTSHTLQ